MRTETPNTIYLKDYAPPAWLVDTVDLHVAIHQGHAEVRARLACRRNPQGAGGALVLNGEALALQTLSLDGAALDPSRYSLADDTLTVAGPLPDAFMLETVVRIEPDANTQLSGLYRSTDGYFSQCESEGFRRITFFPDRPDVMARYTCTIEADRERFPQLLSNGNLAASGTVEHDPSRHWARWDDPFPKPAYLFALVAAKLDMLEDSFVTRSGRTVRLAVYVEPGKLDQCGHAMAALEESDALGRRTLRPGDGPRPLHDRRGGRLQHGGDGKQGPQHLQHQVRAGPPRHRDRRRLPGHRPRRRPRVFPQLDRQPRHLPRLVPALAEGGPHRLPRPGVRRRHAFARRHPHPGRARPARRPVPRGCRARWRIRCVRRPTPRSTTSTPPPSTTRAPKSCA